LNRYIMALKDADNLTGFQPGHSLQARIPTDNSSWSETDRLLHRLGKIKFEEQMILKKLESISGFSPD
ncbi:hypothetical protein Q4595_27375, partial [Wenyingzhuangia sp. 1_MG-2023]|nr:hypothetical protein [Wenyingzhuangia sp. 1_MG-2023]